MKNFRKVLALIMVVATLFSFVAMASAKTAADYSDVDSIKYVEAVDVLSAIGIINGYDGAFHPGDNIDRDEAAKMVAVLRNAGDFNADLYASANKFADAKGSWAEGYIAYCAQIGIIAGRNATTFDPEGKVTGIELMKMLLCTLGYDAKEQGYVGSNWQVNVLRDARLSDLMLGLADMDPYAPATRDEAAQLFLNALQAEMIYGYLSESIVDITNSIFETQGVRVPDVDEDDVKLAYCNAILSDVPLFEIFDGLEYIDTDSDCLGRPGHAWRYRAENRKELFYETYLNTPDWTSTSTTKNELASAIKNLDWNYLEDELGDESWPDVSYYIEGVEYDLDDFDNFWADLGYDSGLLEDDFNNDGRIENLFFGNGTEVEVYGLEDEIRVVVIDKYIAQVGTVSEHYNKFTLVDIYGELLHTYPLGDLDIEEDDIVIYYHCNGDCQKQRNSCKNPEGFKHIDAAQKTVPCYLHDLTVVEPTVVEITEGDIYAANYMSKSYVVGNGETYYYSKNLGNEIDPEARIIRAYDLGNPYDLVTIGDDNLFDLYLDDNGYIMWWTHHNEIDNIGVGYAVEGSAWSRYEGENNWEDKYAYSIDLVRFAEDGELEVEENVATNEELYNEASYTFHDKVNFNEYVKAGRLFKFVDAEDSAEVVTADNYWNVASVGPVFAEFAPVGTILEEGSWTLNADEDIYASSETKFMIRTQNLDGTYTYEQFTGTDEIEGSYIADAVYSLNDDEVYTNIQYFVEEDNEFFAEYVFIDAKYSFADADHFLVLDEIDYSRFESALKWIFGGEYHVYDALVDGERAVVATVMECNVGQMYSTIIAFRGHTATIAGNAVPLYVAEFEETWADEEGGLVEFAGITYTVKGGESYVKTDELGMVKITADTKVFTFYAVENENYNEQLEGYIDQSKFLNPGWAEKLIPELMLDGNEDVAYVYAEDGVATEVYVLTAEYYGYLVEEGYIVP